MAAPKSTPKDAQVMSAILKDMGITEYEPRVINQMLEFTYRYVTTILDDARLFSSHAKKRAVDAEDVRLAVQMQADKSFTSPPPRDLLMEIARQKNSTPLPLIKANAGPRLPPDRYSLTACNYRFKSAKKPRIQVGLPQQLGLSALQGSGNTGLPKVSSALNLASKTGATLAVVTKPASAPTVTIVSRPAITSKTHPAPIIKLSQRPTVAVNVMSSAPAMVTQANSPLVAAAPPVQSVTPSASLPASGVGSPSMVTAVTPSAPQVMQPIINIKTETADADSRKRKREDDDYDAS